MQVFLFILQCNLLLTKIKLTINLLKCKIKIEHFIEHKQDTVMTTYFPEIKNPYSAELAKFFYNSEGDVIGAALIDFVSKPNSRPYYLKGQIGDILILLPC